MKALDLNELYNVPARMQDIPLYVKKEDKKETFTFMCTITHHSRTVTLR